MSKQIKEIKLEASLFKDNFAFLLNELALSKKQSYNLVLPKDVFLIFTTLKAASDYELEETMLLNFNEDIDQIIYKTKFKEDVKEIFAIKKKYIIDLLSFIKQNKLNINKIYLESEKDIVFFEKKNFNYGLKLLFFSLIIVLLSSFLSKNLKLEKALAENILILDNQIKSLSNKASDNTQNVIKGRKAELIISYLQAIIEIKTEKSWLKELSLAEETGKMILAIDSSDFKEPVNYLEKLKQNQNLFKNANIANIKKIKENDYEIFEMQIDF